MIWNRNKATPVTSTGPVVIPNDVAEARAITATSERSQRETELISQHQQTWWERTIAPGLEELRARREQNGFGQEYELSIMPKDRG